MAALRPKRRWNGLEWRGGAAGAAFGGGGEGKEKPLTNIEEAAREEGRKETETDERRVEVGRTVCRAELFANYLGFRQTQTVRNFEMGVRAIIVY